MIRARLPETIHAGDRVRVYSLSWREPRYGTVETVTYGRRDRLPSVHVALDDGSRVERCFAQVELMRKMREIEGRDG